MSIKLIRLTSGEEVLAKITDESNDSITFENPIALYAAEEGKIGFMPYIPYTKAEDGLTVKNTHVLFTVDPVDQILGQYKEATGAIVTPNKGIIV
jgi:hypothetical protein